MTSPVTSLAPLVVVIGASGGLGTSTWAAALARRMSMHFGECVLVDADVRGGGLDMTCGTEHVPGLRWPDLARLRGSVSPSRLVAALPCGEVPVLSAGGRGEPVASAVMLDVLGSVRGQVAVVVDCPASSGLVEELVAGAGFVHVVSGLQARQLADTEALVCALSRWGGGAGAGPAAEAGVGLVTRGTGGLGSEFDEVLEHLGVPHLAHVRDDPRVRREGEKGEWPGIRGSLRDSADRVVLDLMDASDTGAA